MQTDKDGSFEETLAGEVVRFEPITDPYDVLYTPWSPKEKELAKFRYAIYLDTIIRIPNHPEKEIIYEKLSCNRCIIENRPINLLHQYYRVIHEPILE